MVIEARFEVEARELTGFVGVWPSWGISGDSGSSGSSGFGDFAWKKAAVGPIKLMCSVLPLLSSGWFKKLSSSPTIMSILFTKLKAESEPEEKPIKRVVLWPQPILLIKSVVVLAVVQMDWF